MSDGPWIKFYPSDWLTGTNGLSPSERGIYITLVAMMYEKNGHIPLDETILARTCGCAVAAFKTALETLLSTGKLNRDDAGRLTNRRVEQELSARASQSAVRATAAKSRWEKDKENQQTVDANAMHNASTRARARNQNSDIRVEDQPSVEAQAPEPSPKQILMSALDEETADAVIKHRKAKRAPLTTALAARGLVKAFLEYPGGPIEAATMMVTNGWTGFKRDYWDKGQPRGSPTGRPLTGLAAVTQEFRKELENDGYADQGEEGGNPDADARLPLLAITDHGRGR